ncbi:uncharacterized protein [Periplaneta americana]|uniref:uncharacterized protein isoform X3 n=1 Tax=Periplaneta americana TaxID=6978 RepID=UPI0037E8591C
MATAQSLVDALPRYGVMLALVLVLATSGQGSTPVPASLQSREHKTPAWWPLLQCVLLADFNKCLQDRTLRAFVGLGKNDELRIDPVKGTVKLPGEREEGIYDMLGDIVSDGISRLFQDDDDEDEDTKRSGKQEVEEDEEDDEDGVHALESAEHGRTKKKIKKLVHLIKFIVVIVLIALKIVFLLYIFGKVLEFKMLLLVATNTLINIVHLFLEWKKGKDDHSKIVHYEEAHHEHIHENSHYDDKGWLGGVWGRSDLDGGRALSDPHDLAYAAHRPSTRSR